NAFIFGNEGDGVSQDIIKNSDEKVIIPIYGSAESLNVAMATGIILYNVRKELNKK
ncbi:MAG: TrmH family RNA methyltransferase, partial [Cetobacterium sp.]